jgi:hypothetical protein
MYGYAHPAYAKTFGDFGKPRELPLSKGWILERQIPGGSHRDARGCYPMFFCQDWRRLEDDMVDVGDLVSLVLVTDPFGNYDTRLLQRCFPDLMQPYKEHFVVDLEQPLSSFISNTHARNIRAALRKVDVELCENPLTLAEEWSELYAGLVQRQGIKGPSAFSKTALIEQLSIPGIVAFRAVHQETTVGIILFFQHKEIVHGHLVAYTDLGYRLGASDALLYEALEYFRTKAKWLNHGAGAGVRNNGKDGLTRFKRGWSNGTRTVYLCGRIIQPQTYAELATTKAVSGSDYFPVYRHGEFE